MAEKVQGSVKWFSNKKGYGFITPAEGSSITEDVFVHQSSIFCEGYRTLVSIFLSRASGFGYTLHNMRIDSLTLNYNLFSVFLCRMKSGKWSSKLAMMMMAK